MNKRLQEIHGLYRGTSSYPAKLTAEEARHLAKELNAAADRLEGSKKP